MHCVIHGDDIDTACCTQLQNEMQRDMSLCLEGPEHDKNTLCEHAPICLLPIDWAEDILSNLRVSLTESMETTEGLRARSTGNTNPAVYTGLHSLYRLYLENKVTNVALFPRVAVLLVDSVFQSAWRSCDSA